MPSRFRAASWTTCALAVATFSYEQPHRAYKYFTRDLLLCRVESAVLGLLSWNEAPALSLRGPPAKAAPAMPIHLSFTAISQDDTTVELGGELDMATAPLFRDVVQSVECSSLTVDLRDPHLHRCQRPRRIRASPLPAAS